MLLAGVLSQGLGAAKLAQRRRTGRQPELPQFCVLTAAFLALHDVICRHVLQTPAVLSSDRPKRSRLTPRVLARVLSKPATHTACRLVRASAKQTPAVLSR